MKFEPEDHWVNNPLISPANKVAAFDKAIADAEKAAEERIIRLLQEPYWHNLRSPGIHEDCKMCETIWLINDRNIL